MRNPFRRRKPQRMPLKFKNTPRWTIVIRMPNRETPYKELIVHLGKWYDMPWYAPNKKKEDTIYYFSAYHANCEGQQCLEGFTDIPCLTSRAHPIFNSAVEHVRRHAFPIDYAD